jgi:hypothetical protein
MALCFEVRCGSRNRLLLRLSYLIWPHHTTASEAKHRPPIFLMYTPTQLRMFMSIQSPSYEIVPVILY